MTFNIALRNSTNPTRVSYAGHELEDAYPLMEGIIGPHYPMVIDEDQSEIETERLRVRATLPEDVESGVVVVRPQEESRTVEIEADSLEIAMHMAREDFSLRHLEVDESLTEELNQE